MDTIHKIDLELKKQFEQLAEEIKLMNFGVIAEFKLNEAATKIPWDHIVYSGIYLIEIKNNKQYDNFDDWVLQFKTAWENDEYRKNFTSNLKKLRIRAHTQLEDWIPLYIGKSKNIGARVHEHIYKKLEKTTFALKLMERKNLADETFRLKTIRIEVENYDAILPRVEWQLRNQINPIIGKQ